MNDNLPHSPEDLSPAEWLGLPTREQMLEQQCRLIEAECLELQRDLSRCRHNTARLVQMHAEAIAERDQLARELRECRLCLSAANVRTSALEQKILWGMMRRDQMIDLLKAALAAQGGDAEALLYHYRDDAKTSGA